MLELAKYTSKIMHKSLELKLQKHEISTLFAKQKYRIS